MTMNTSMIYIDPELLSAVKNMARERFGIGFNQIGLIILQNQKKEFKKVGIDVASDVLNFVIFDTGLKKIGVIKRSDIQAQMEARP